MKKDFLVFLFRIKNLKITEKFYTPMWFWWEPVKFSSKAARLIILIERYIYIVKGMIELLEKQNANTLMFSLVLFDSDKTDGRKAEVRRDGRKRKKVL